jgi:hypothetical protein
VVVGSRPQGFAPIISIFDSREREIVLVGVIQDDLVVRNWTIARTLELDQPDVRLTEAFAGLSVGDTVAVGIDAGSASYCLSVDRRTECGLAPGLGDGWALLLNLEGSPSGLRTMMALTWSLCLGAGLGLAVVSARRACAIALILAVTGSLLASMTPDVRSAVPHAVFLVLGTVLGGLLKVPWALTVDFLHGDVPVPSAFPLSASRSSQQE